MDSFNKANRDNWIYGLELRLDGEKRRLSRATSNEKKERRTKKVAEIEKELREKDTEMTKQPNGSEYTPTGGKWGAVKKCPCADGKHRYVLLSGPIADDGLSIPGYVQVDHKAHLYSVTGIVQYREGEGYTFAANPEGKNYEALPNAAAQLA